MRLQLHPKHIIIASGLFALGFLNSCVKEGCTDAVATNYDSKVKKDDGSCIYSKDQFIGDYTVSETCTSGTSTYDISVSESSTGNTFIQINNFGDYTVNLTATVSGNDITFNQTESGVNFTGNGSIEGNTLTINYTAVVGGATDSCIKTCIKQ